MVASVFRHFDTGPLRGKVQCQDAWSNVLYVNNLILDYGEGVSSKHFYLALLFFDNLCFLFLVYWSGLVHGM